MANEGLKQLLIDGIHAVQGADKAGSEAASKMEAHATHPELQAELRHGSEVAERWRQRLASAQRAVGDSAAPTDNEIMKAIQHTGEKIVRHAETAQARDLGIVATGQIALHYNMAAFGTLAAYAKQLGLTDVAGAMHECLNEAKAEDARHTELSAKLMAATA